MKGIFAALFILWFSMKADAINTHSSVNQPTKGTVIILNGPSAAGKSSLQRAVQETFDEPYIAVGIDNLFNDIIPDEHGSKVTVKSDPELYRSVTYSIDSEKSPVVTLNIGPQGEKLFRGMHGAIAAYARAGNNVVVDYIQYQKQLGQDLREALKGLKVVYVKVDIPLEELEKRESRRGTSPPGNARSHYATVHDGMPYDVVVDTSKMTAMEAATMIRDKIQPQ